MSQAYAMVDHGGFYSSNVMSAKSKPGVAPGLSRSQTVPMSVLSGDSNMFNDIRSLNSNPSEPRRNASNPSINNSSSPSLMMEPLNINGKRLNTPSGSQTPVGVVQIQPQQAKPTSVSLYQTGLQLLDRLYDVPGLLQYLDETEPVASTFPMRSNAAVGEVQMLDNTGIDPVSHLWRCFMLGTSLCCLFNALRLDYQIPLEPHPTLADRKKCKDAVYKFLVAIRDHLGMTTDSTFTISQLYLNDMDGIVKAMKTVSAVVDEVEARGYLVPSGRKKLCDLNIEQDSQSSYAKTVKELITTERDYVNSLEELQAFQRKLQQEQVLTNDTIHLLFANLSSVVDFQRRFLIGLEGIVAKPPEQQNFGLWFRQMEEGFSVYEPFCANYQYASELALEEEARLSSHINVRLELPSLLIKPVQRICKYPLLLRQLLKFSNAEEGSKQWEELMQGVSSIERVTNRVNETKRQQENDLIVRELHERISDWKTARPSTFGDLLLADTFPLLQKDKEKIYNVYLFETIILCCIDQTAQNDLKKKNKTKTMSLQKRPTQKGEVGGKRGGSLQLKGRIKLEDIVDLRKNNLGQYILSVSWFDSINPEEQSFIAKMKNEETLEKWYKTIFKYSEIAKHLRAERENGGALKDAAAIVMAKQNQAINKWQMAAKQVLEKDREAGYVFDRDRSPPSPPDSLEEASIMEQQYDIVRRQTTSNVGTTGSHQYKSLQRLPPNRFPPNPHGPPPSVHSHTRTGSMNQLSAQQGGSYFSPATDSPPVPVQPTGYGNWGSPYHTNGYGQYPFPRQDSTSTLDADDRMASDMRRSVSRDGYVNGIPTPPLTAQSMRIPPSAISPRPTIHPLVTGPGMNGGRLRSTSTPNIHERHQAHGYPPPFARVPPVPIQTVGLRSGDLLDSPSDSSNSAITMTSNATPISGASFISRPLTSASMMSSMPVTPATSSASSLRDREPIAPRITSSNPKPYALTAIKVKINYDSDIFVIVVSTSVTYRELLSKVQKKISICAHAPDGPLRIRYQDEDGDFVTINSDDDVAMAVESRIQHQDGRTGPVIGGAGVINLFVNSA